MEQSKHLHNAHLDKQFRFILLIMVASHSLASVRNMFTLDWHTLRLSLREEVYN